MCYLGQFMKFLGWERLLKPEFSFWAWEVGENSALVVFTPVQVFFSYECIWGVTD
jgi:hypothetical protein